MILPVIAYPVINPVALKLGPFSVRWYGLAYLVAFVAAGLIMRWLSRRWELELSDDDQLTVVLGAVIGIIVGGRLGYVIAYGGGYYAQHPAAAFAIWDGGMSFHGGLVGVLLAGAILARSLHMPWLTLCDIGAVGAPIGLFLGRIANFINDELWGRVTNVPWAMVFPGAGPQPRHPSQLYEAGLEGVVMFAVVMWIATRPKAPWRGVLLGWLLTLYGVFRIFVEFFRQPDIQMGTGGFLAGGVTTGQVLSLPVLAVGIGLLVWAYRAQLPELGPAASTASADE